MVVGELDLGVPSLLEPLGRVDDVEEIAARRRAVGPPAVDAFPIEEEDVARIAGGDGDALPVEAPGLRDVAPEYLAVEEGWRTRARARARTRGPGAGAISVPASRPAALSGASALK